MAGRLLCARMAQRGGAERGRFAHVRAHRRDIRPNCIDALQKLVGKIKNDLVEEKEIYA